MKYLHIKFIKLDKHPCKRDPIPFLGIESKLSDSSYTIKTTFVNSIPPSWEEKFIFEVKTTDNVNLEISFLESRLLMKTEEFGRISIPLSVFSLNTSIIDWIPVEKTREYIENSHLLVLFHLSDNQNSHFNKEFGTYLVSPPWEKIPISESDLLEAQDNNDECNRNQTNSLKDVFSSIFHHFQAK